MHRILLLFLTAFLSLTQLMADITPGTYYLQTATRTFIYAQSIMNNSGAHFSTASATPFTITAVDGGYTIRNEANGNYLLYATKNNYGTKMSASDSETDFAVLWTITEAADGTVSISRTFSDKTYYLGNQTTGDKVGVFSGETAPVPYTLIPLTIPTGENVVTGDGSIQLLQPVHYITNTSTNSDGSKKFVTVPVGKAWQMEMVVENTNKSGADPHFNEYGSTILASNGDPFNQKYMGDFQVYQHAPTHKSPNTLNFKASKEDGYDHIIAQGASVANKNYKVIVRYNGDKVYVVRTIFLDDQLQETTEVYNNVWVSVQAQNAISQMSTALPAGINLQSLRISIAEESNLLEGVDYAIQNISTHKYLTGTQPSANSIYAGDASKYQIEFTGNDDLTYAEQDGALHYSFYIKTSEDKYLTSSGSTVTDKASATPFIYTTNQHIAPITAKNTLDTEWTIDGQNTWLFDFFANFLVEVAGNSNGGLLYLQGGQQHTAKNGEYLELPASFDVAQQANSSQPGYSAAITKQDIRIKVQYTPLANTFYTITDKSTSTSTLYYWYKDLQTLVTYRTGAGEEWGEKGDCSKFTIAQSLTIPVALHQNAIGTNADNRYYATIYCPNDLTLPDGVTAYRLDSYTTDSYLLKPIEVTDCKLPAGTPAVLISNTDQSGNWSIVPANKAPKTDDNHFSGVYINTANPGAGAQASSTIYILSNMATDNANTDDRAIGLAFYPYSGDFLPAFRAYHQLSATSSAPARFAFTFSDDDDPSAITVPTTDVPTAPYYDQMGRPVAHPLPGHLYIHNGKTIIY